MMLRSRLTRVFPRLFCRSISAASSSSSSSSSSSLSETSSAGESCSEAEDGEVNFQAHQIQVLRAFLRNRRSRCLARVREQGLVPAVLVDPDKERRPKDGSTDVFLSLDAKPLVALLKLIGKRDFVSRVFDMEIYRSPTSSELKESLQVLPRNLNYGPGKTNILNIQFVRALPGQDVKLGVPLEFLGIDQCPGLQKGGTLMKFAKYIVYKCKATELPAKIVVDMSVLEIGDRVRVQDLEVDDNLLDSDKTMVVCEIVKDVRTLKAKARRLKNELLYKKKALAEKQSSSVQQHALSEDEVEVSDDGEDEVIPYRYQKQKALAKERASMKKASTKTVFAEPGEEGDNAKVSSRVESRKSVKPSKRRLTGTSVVSSRGEKLDEQAERRYVSLSTRKPEVFKVPSDSDEDGASRSVATKQGLRSGHRGPREHYGKSSGSKRPQVLDDFESIEEAGVLSGGPRKRTALKALESWAESDLEDEDDKKAHKTPTRKALSMSRRGSGVRAQKERQKIKNKL